MEHQSSSRYLLEHKPNGTISVNDFYIADFNILRRGDVITGLFAKIDNQYFVKAELYIDYILHAVIDAKNLNSLNNELRFFSDDLFHCKIPLSCITIRIIYNKNCVEHAKIYTLHDLYKDSRLLQPGSIYIPAAVSVTGKDIPMIYRATKDSAQYCNAGIITSELFPTDGDKLIFTPVCNRSCSNMHSYKFSCPHLGLLKTIRCIGGSLAEASIQANGLIISTIKITERDQELVFFHNGNDKHMLETNSLKYCDIQINISAFIRMDSMRIELEYVYESENLDYKDKIVLIDDKTKEVLLCTYQGGLEARNPVPNLAL